MTNDNEKPNQIIPYDPAQGLIRKYFNESTGNISIVDRVKIFQDLKKNRSEANNHDFDLMRYFEELNWLEEYSLEQNNTCEVVLGGDYINLRRILNLQPEYAIAYFNTILTRNLSKAFLRYSGATLVELKGLLLTKLSKRCLMVVVIKMFEIGAFVVHNFPNWIIVYSCIKLSQKFVTAVEDIPVQQKIDGSNTQKRSDRVRFNLTFVFKSLMKPTLFYFYLWILSKSVKFVFQEVFQSSINYKLAYFCLNSSIKKINSLFYYYQFILQEMKSSNPNIDFLVLESMIKSYFSSDRI